MLIPRRIPTLQIYKRQLVKTRQFKNIKYVGDALNAVKIWNEKQVDELMIFDIHPHRAKTGPDFDFIKILISECQMPVGYGGGIRDIEDAQRIFDLGVEKIVVNTLAFEKPEIVAKIIQAYGSQAVSLSLDFKINIFKRVLFYKDSANKKLSMNLEFMLEHINQIHYGEIILHDIQRDGSFLGLRHDLLNFFREKTSIPLVSLGGVGSKEDFENAIQHGAHSVAAGSFFIYRGPHKAVLIQYE